MKLRILSIGRRSGVVAIAGSLVAAIMIAGAPASHADIGNLDVVSLYSADALDVASINAGQATNTGNNITCQPSAVTEGTLVAPRVGYVVGEVYGETQSAASWTCASLDTGAKFTMNGTVTDRYATPYGTRNGCVGGDSMPAVAGVATLKPLAAPCTYAGGSAALNTWHWAVFHGTAPGHVGAGISQLYYVPGV